jgi:hypothetical protein
MKKQFLPGILVLISFSSLQAQSPPLSSNHFLQQDKKEGTYQCIQIRRGDIITLTGRIEVVNKEIESDQENLYFTSTEGRTFLLKGRLLSEIKTFYQTISENIILTGKILFEGREEQYAEMEVSAYKVSE